jgi:hypothetical protein
MADHRLCRRRSASSGGSSGGPSWIDHDLLPSVERRHRSVCPTRGPHEISDPCLHDEGPGCSPAACPRVSASSFLDKQPASHQHHRRLTLRRSRTDCHVSNLQTVDPADEILANKLTAIVGRAEERDLIDVMLLERAGYPVEAALPAALAKDGGCTPATLAWLLSEVKIPDGIELPAGVPPAELRVYLAELIRRLLVLAAPEEPGVP